MGEGRDGAARVEGRVGRVGLLVAEEVDGGGGVREVFEVERDAQAAGAGAAEVGVEVEDVGCCGHFFFVFLFVFG